MPHFVNNFAIPTDAHCQCRVWNRTAEWVSNLKNSLRIGQALRVLSGRRQQKLDTPATRPKFDARIWQCDADKVSELLIAHRGLLLLAAVGLGVCTCKTSAAGTLGVVLISGAG